MKALTIIPKKIGSTRIIDIEKPKIEVDEVLVKVLQTGICRTDIEIYQGLYGEAPPESEYLVMGHESIGVVALTGKNVSSFRKGDFVVRTVRRPCQDGCKNCSGGENDMCLTGNYKEIGIKGFHGVIAEYYKEKPEFLVKVPKKFRDFGVLLEPLSFAEKTIYQAIKVQERMAWEPKNALILGSGTIGLLLTMILKDMGIETTTAARSIKGSIKSEIVKELDGVYVGTSGKPLEEMLDKKRKYNIVIEASGNAKMAYEAMEFISNNGILCLTSITGDNQIIDFPISHLNLEFVLGNKVLVGVVNANIRDYHRGVKRFHDLEKKWPGIVGKLITDRIPLERYREGFSEGRQGIKTVVYFE